MATYQRKTNQTIEAVQFTPALGDIVRRFALGELPKLPDDVPERLVWREQGGYRLDDAPIGFGDYIVGNAVVSRDDFERQYEPAHPAVGGPAPNSAAVEAAIEQAQAGALDEALSDVPSHAVPAKRSRRTTTESA